MQDIKRQLDPTLLAILNLLGIVSIMGLVYCMLILLHGTFFIATTDLTLYLIWFAISYLSISIMKKGDIWGAYALGIATFVVTLYDLTQGHATLGGAMLGITVLSIVTYYIKAATAPQDTLSTTFNH